MFHLTPAPNDPILIYRPNVAIKKVAFLQKDASAFKIWDEFFANRTVVVLHQMCNQRAMLSGPLPPSSTRDAPHSTRQVFFFFSPPPPLKIQYVHHLPQGTANTIVHPALAHKHNCYQSSPLIQPIPLSF